MRAFLLIALLAMAATVSCQSTVCKTQSDAFETNANLTQTEAYIVKSGCTELNFNDTQCTQTGDNYACQCTQTFDNKTAWETAVTGAGGRACYLGVEYTLVGAVVVNNVTREVRVTGTQTGVENLAVPTVCNDTDIKAAFAPFVTKLVAVLTNAQNIQKGNATWISGSMSVSACGTTVTETRTFGTGTTNPPTTQAPTTPSGTTTQPPTGSSTGKNAASIIASSVALVASLIAAVTILA